ncbi:hypothetical protein [Sphingomonas oryzagri]
MTGKPNPADRPTAANERGVVPDPEVKRKDAELDVELDESFPASDVPSEIQPGSSEPTQSSGYDEELERRIQEGRGRPAPSKP